MPDIGKYSPEQPFVPQFFSQLNLSNAFIPRVTVPQTLSPEGIGPGNSTWKFFLQGATNPFAGRGIVPSAPAATDDYYSNQKFLSKSDEYQSGSTYKDIGFLIGRDNEDLWAKNRTWWDETFNTVVRLFDKAGAYTVQGLGFLGGLIGIGNKHNNYHSGSNFADWIAGASDNGLAQWGRDVADDVDNIYRPIYNEAADRDKGFFSRMFTDIDFWKGDVVDGAAFMLSAYATGNIFNGLNLGGSAVRGINAMRGLQFADEAAALSAEGLSGMSEAAALSRGATMTAEGGTVIPGVLSREAGAVMTDISRGIANSPLAKGINMGVTTLMLTASESMTEASTLKDELAEKLLRETKEDGTAKYTPEQIRDITARAARNSFLLNMLVLGPSNLWEVKTFFGKGSAMSGRNAANRMVRHEAGVLSDAEIVKRTFGQRGLDYLKRIGQGTLVEGLWEENIQLAIERTNQDPETLDNGFFKNIGRALNQYFKQTGDAFSGDDREASFNIGIGGIIGGGMAVRGRFGELKQLKRDVTNYNAAVSSFRNTSKNFYETNPDGSIAVDNNGNPVINNNNVISFLSAMNKTLSMSELADNLKGKNMDLLHSLVDNENIARLVKAYADNGMVDVLINKLDKAKNFKSEDLMILGLTSDAAQNATRLDYLKKKIELHKNIYDNVKQNFIVKVRNDDKFGTKANLMQQSLYFLSTRAAQLAELRDKTATEAEDIGTELATRYSSSTDGMVDQLNDLYNKYLSAKKRVDMLSTQTLELPSSMRTLPDSDTETVDLGNGVKLTTPKKQTKVHPEERQAVDEETLSQAVTEMTNSEAALKQFLIDNKDEVKNIRKNADGSFRYEIAERNRLSYDSGKVRKDRIAKDIDMARNATLNVFNRISDAKYGERYWDTVYGQRKQDLQDEVENDDNDQIEENLPDNDPNTPQNPPDEGEEAISPEKKAKMNAETKSEDDLREEEQQLNEEKDYLNSKEEVLTKEEEDRLEEIDDRLDTIEKVREQKRDERNNEHKVDESKNIKPEDKENYKDILNKISENKKRVKKFNTHYEIDGQYFRKVSEIIGDNITVDQSAANKGYTVDSIVKAFFANEITDEFKADLASKISEEALNDMMKQLTAIKASLQSQGIEIIDNNVTVFDEDLKVAGEIDLLGIDKDGNFKIYEISARRPEVYRVYGKSGKGISIRELDGKRLSAYRNLFANQYGAVPDEISVMFPFAVTYDKADPNGFIEGAKLKQKIRFVPERSIEIKMKVFKPVRSGSKFDAFDLFTYFANTYLPSTLKDARDKLNFLFRNESFDNIKKNLTLRVSDLEGEFLTAYNNQQDILSGKKSSEVKITFDLNKIKKPSGSIGNQGATFEQARDIMNHLGITINYNGDSLKQIVEHLKNNPQDKQRFMDFLTNEPIVLRELPDGTFQLEDGHHRATIAYYSGIENVPAILKKNGTKTNTLNKAAYRNSFGNRIEFDNLYALRSPKSMALFYDKELVGYLAPIPALAYRDEQGKYHVLSATTDQATYTELTGNSAQTYADFQKLAKAYSTAYTNLISKLEQSGQKEMTLENKELQDLFDVNLSYGELDTVKANESRPTLNDLDFKGVTVGNRKNVVTVANLDEYDGVRVVMDKNKATKTAKQKLQDLDRWANNNVSQIKSAVTDKNGKRSTNWVAIVETPNGEYKIIALREKGNIPVDLNDDFVVNLGDKFSASVKTSVFKNSNMQVVPKVAEATINIDLKDAEIMGKVYAAEDVESIEQFGLDPTDLHTETNDEKVNSFLNSLSDDEVSEINSKFAAFPQTRDELAKDIIDEYHAGMWSNIEDFLNDLKNCP